jgi:IS30 family transposase
MERKEIYKLIRKGCNFSEIAYLLGRGKQTVIGEIRRNGGKQKYDPIKAQKGSKERKIERDMKCGESIKKKSDNLKEKIENLEKHILKLTEEVKILTKRKRK